jgi:hypothetical protein
MLSAFLHICAPGRYNNPMNPTFEVFREATYNPSCNPQKQINDAIDSVFFGPDAGIAIFFKKYLDVKNYKIVNAQMTDNPHFKLTIVTDALKDLEFLIGLFGAGDASECVLDDKVTPPRPRSPRPVSTIYEKPDEEESDEEESDEEE